ncbi:MAG TPA: FAD-dependent oxidoreductase [Planktothrix sp.]
MANNERFGRREFLSRAAGTALLASGIQGLADLLSPSSVRADGVKSKYKIAPWTGDDFTMGHKLRARQLPQFPKAAERTVDFVIVGGGMAGLSAAHYLRHHNYLLLEQYDSLGGQSRGSQSNGLGYSYGAAYIGDLQGEPGKLVSELGLKPIKLEGVDDSWRWENEWVSGTTGDTKPLYHEFKRLRDSAQSVWGELKKGTALVPLNDAGFSKLDQTTFAASLSGYDGKFIALMDAFLKSYNCLGVERTSALAGFATLADLVDPVHVFEGGNQVLSNALAAGVEKEPSRFVKKAFVWAVENGENTAVVYSTADGVVHRVNCRFAIICIPPMVGARILTGISDEARAAMLSFKYGSYLVANIMLDKEIFSAAYDNWVTSPYTFADIVLAEKPYQRSGQYKAEMGSILTVYQPYEPGSMGRPELLMGDKEAFASSLVTQLTKLLGSPLDDQIREIVLSRWGHAMAAPVTGFFSKVSKMNSTVSGAYALAHCSTQGLACAEGAITAAQLASMRALNTKHSAYVHFPNSHYIN